MGWGILLLHTVLYCTVLYGTVLYCTICPFKPISISPGGTKDLIISPLGLSVYDTISCPLGMKTCKEGTVTYK